MPPAHFLLLEPSSSSSSPSLSDSIEAPAVSLLKRRTRPFIVVVTLGDEELCDDAARFKDSFNRQVSSRSSVCDGSGEQPKWTTHPVLLKEDVNDTASVCDRQVRFSIKRCSRFVHL